MNGIPVGRRRFHAFVSHAHVDKAQADRLVRWLRDIASVPVWYDADDLPPGGTIARALPDAIDNSRSLILLLSEKSVTRGWVEQEWSAALDQQTRHPDFRIIPVRLDDVEPPGFLRNYSNVAMATDDVDLDAAVGIVKGLYQPTTTIHLGNGRDVYLARGWRTGDEPLGRECASVLASAGLQLVGDAQDQTSSDETRITGIMRGCGAFAAVLPYRPGTPHDTSEYVLREWEVADSLGLDSFVIADPRITSPLAVRPGLVNPDGGPIDPETLADAAAAFAERWQEPAKPRYIFLATDFEPAGATARQAIKNIVESVTALPCVLGEYVRGEVVQQEIVRSVCDAILVLADITADSPNIYIEIGAARAAGTPLALLRRGPSSRPPFMLRDREVMHYPTDAELLGHITRLIYPHRRMVLTPRS